MQETASDRTPHTVRGARLSKHADYQRVYQQSRKHFSCVNDVLFCRAVRMLAAASGPRVGLTAGRVLGKAVERNRIKRRMREAVRLNLGPLHADVDVVLHPRTSVFAMEFAKLVSEVGRIFDTVEARQEGQTGEQP